ncbi:sulfotransferase [Chondrocystis sp. NIES-4102]|nr:sulfotransferase [Chondrocystis sp. NIES-4102]
MSQKYLFVCGCPRSGTTALVKLLNSHNSIGIGMERYKYYASKDKINKINPSSFEEDRFFDFKEDQTNIIWSDFYDNLKIKYANKITYLGDKYPHYYNFYSELNQEFRNTKWIFMLRDIVDVAMSYDHRAANPLDKWSEKADYTKAVVHWNDSLAKTWKYIKTNKNKNLFVCQYEKLFAYDESYLKSLTDFLDVDFSQEISSFYSTMTKNWKLRIEQKANIQPKKLEYIQQNAKIALKENLVRIVQKDNLLQPNHVN